MATFQLVHTKEQIDNANSGAYHALIDAWGYTGNSKVIGDTFSSFSHMGSGAVADFFTVSGDQTGHGVLANKLFTDLKDLSVTGDAYLPSITGYTAANHITSETGNFAYITGDMVKHGNTSFTGALFNFTGDDVSFKLNSAKSLTIELTSGGGGDIVMTGYDNAAFRGDSMTFDNKLNGHEFLGEINHTEGTFHTTENAYFSGEIWRSGVQLEVNQINQYGTTGNYNVVFHNKGELFVGVGLKTGETFPIGTNGQLLQVDLGAGGGNVGMKWVDSGIFAGGGGGAGDLSGLRTVYDAVPLNTILEPTRSAGYGLSLRTNQGFSVVASGANIATQGTYAINIQPKSTQTAAVTSAYGIAIGDLNTVTTTGDAMSIGTQNHVQGGRYNTAIGHFNQITVESNDYSFVGGYQNYSSGNADVILGLQNIVESTDPWGAYKAVVNSHSIMIGSGNKTSMEYETGTGPSEFGMGGKYGKTTLIGNENFGNGESGILIGNANSGNIGSITMGHGNVGYKDYIQMGNYNSGNGLVATKGVTLGYHGYISRHGQIAESVAPDWHQGSKFVWGGSTSNASATEIFLGGAASNRLLVPSDSTLSFTFFTTARRIDGGGAESAGYKHEGVLKNDAGTVAAVGTISNTVLGEDAAAWSAVMSADNTNKSLTLTVQGEASKDIEWRTYGFAVEYQE